jgi:hypothetical protein
MIAVMGSYLMPAMFASTIHVPLPLTHLFIYAYFGAIAGRYGRSRKVQNTYKVTPYGHDHDLGWAKKT